MIQIKDLNINLTDFNLTDINLNIDENQFFVLMGPTGAGKTVLLEAIAGLLPAKKGKVIIDNIDITQMPPEKRGVSIMYQGFSLFPHLDVEENITYGLKYKKISKPDAQKRLDRLIEQLSLKNLLTRAPYTLSGGEIQRTALARALIVEPKVLLLDEPISSLDPNFKEEIRDLLKKLHTTSKTTFLMVTHDFVEALSLADRAAILNNGRIEQTGSIQDIFEKPNSTFAANFVGMKNVFLAAFKQQKALIKSLEIELAGTTSAKQKQGYIAIRPEDIVLSKKALASSMRNSFKGTVSGISDKGFTYEIDINVKDVIFKSLITKRSLFELKIKEGAKVYISFKATAIHNF